MRKGFVIVIGVAATGVMALGAQTATSTTVEPVDSVPPDLQLSGDKTQRQGGIHTPGTDSLHLGRPVLVKASCGELSVGPPVSDPLQESVPPEPWAANLPDTACALSAEGKVFAGARARITRWALYASATGSGRPMAAFWDHTWPAPASPP